MLVLKVSLQQKDLDIKSLNELLERKDDIISQNDSTIEHYVQEVNLFKKKDVKNNEMIENKNEMLSSDKNKEIIQNLRQKVVNEQEINKQTEEEIIKLKIDFENLSQELITATEKERAMPKDYQTNLINSKDKEVERLEKEILQEQQIVAHVQVTQEKEIIEKEKEISILNTILTQERQVLLEKEREIENLLILKYQVKLEYRFISMHNI